MNEPAFYERNFPFVSVFSYLNFMKRRFFFKSTNRGKRFIYKYQIKIELIDTNEL